MTDIRSIVPTDIHFPAEKDYALVRVDAERPGWTVSGSGTHWCYIDHLDDSTVMVRVLENKSDKARETSVYIISGDDMDDSQEIKVTQDGKS